LPNLKHEATAFFKLRGELDEGRSGRLERELGTLDGVIKVEVNFILDVVSVEYDPDKLMLDDIKEKVDGSRKTSKRLGKHPAPRRPASRKTPGIS
jgi:copper chaperone CopZ